jgi:enoyl-CoA hydratase
MQEELATVFRDAGESDARVVLLTGNGPTFSAGGDVNVMADRLKNPNAHRWEEAIETGIQTIEHLVNLNKPIVAKVNGDAIGHGATLALFCDLVYMNENAQIGDPHITVGLAAGDGGAVIWPILTNIHKAKEILLTGSLITGEEAEEIGLINKAVPENELDSEVNKIIEELATGPQLAIQYTKVCINKWLKQGIDNILRESLALEGISHYHPDHEEAVSAFLEEREPTFPSARNPEN